jgi:hypothetical protein
MFEDFEDFDFDFEDDGVPRIRVDSATSVTDLELTLQSNHDDFFRRIVDHILSRLEGDRQVLPVAILIDEEGVEYEMQVEEDGYNKALDKANDYFVTIEEYETCDLIKQMYEIIEKKNELR